MGMRNFVSGNERENKKYNLIFNNLVESRKLLIVDSPLIKTLESMNQHLKNLAGVRVLQPRLENIEKLRESPELQYSVITHNFLDFHQTTRNDENNYSGNFVTYNFNIDIEIGNLTFRIPYGSISYIIPFLIGLIPLLKLHPKNTNNQRKQNT